MTPEQQARFSVEGRRALVTGGSKGIGAVAARTLAEAGADVAVVGRDAGGLEATARAVREAGRRCVAITADLAAAEGAVRAAEEALDALGGVDILVNNAGVAPLAPLVDLSLEAWESTLAVNLRAPFLLARALAPQMLARDGGAIVNVSSQAGQAALEGHAAYSASKGGLDMLTRTMALEWGPGGVRTNAVAPTVILTPMAELNWSDPAKAEPMLDKIPLRRFGTPQEVADLILFLASDASAMICGAVVSIDGGYTAL